MADVNANIGVNIDASDALAQLKQLQRQISQFHSSIQKSSESAAIAQRNLTKNFLNSVNSIQGFSAELKTVRTTAETFTNSLEKNKFSMREYFRYAGASTKTFGRLFTNEFNTIEKVAIERVKTLQTQYIKLGRDASGAMQSIAIRPTILDMNNLGTQVQMAAQKQALFNQLVKQGSTNLLNFGKNTQWAGRQLMVGFTLPLATFGTVASKSFMEMEAQVIKFKKVYGDLFTADEERQQALKDIQALAESFNQYGIASAETVGLAAEAAAAGFAGVDLQRQVTQATRLSVLGQVESQKALETTIALQNAFRISSEQLAESINFLNAVENQTVVSLDDVTTAIPKVAPVIQSLGGDVKDLAFFLAAMKEGGINASEGANALKSGLAALINPTDKAAEFVGGLGINLRGIVESNAGNISGIMNDFALALDRLDPLNRARAIEQLFGKFQFARISTLFENIIRDGNQASRVLELSSASVEELAMLADKELGVTAESSMNKFLGAVEGLRAALAPIGEIFLNVITPIIEKIAEIAQGFNKLPDGVKRAITILVTVIGGLGPIILMTFGLLANAVANSIKFIAMLRNGYLRLTGQSQILGESTEYLTQEQLEATAAAASLDQAHAKLTQRFTAEAGAVNKLRDAYLQALTAGNQFAKMNPGMMRPGSPKKFASGGMVGGSGNGDTVPAMLTPGEFVVKKEAAMKMLPFLEALNKGTLPGFAEGGSVKPGSTGRIGSGASGRKGKSLMTLPISYKANVSQQAGALSISDIVANQQSLAYLYANEILKQAGVSAAAVSQEIKVWQQANTKAIQTATDAVNAGVPASEAFESLAKQFVTDMKSAGGPTDRFANTAQTMFPQLEKDLKEVQVTVKRLGLNLRKAADTAQLAEALPNNMLAQGLNTPGNYGRLSKVRGAASTIFSGGSKDFGQTGVPAFMMTRGMDTTSLAYGSQMSQEHFAVTKQQEIHRQALAHARKTADLVEQEFVNGINEAAQSKSPSKRAKKAGKNIADGAIQGLEEGAKGAQKAGQQVGSRYRDPATGRFAKAPAAGSVAAPVLANLDTLSSKLMGASFAIGTVGGAMTMFGGKVGEVGGIIMQLSTGLFALLAVTELLTKAKLQEALASAKNSITNLMGGATGLKGIGNIFKNLGPIIARVAGAFLRFLPVIGIVVTAFTLFKIVSDQKEKVEALGNAANFTADQVKSLGERLGQQNVRTADFGAQFVSGQAASQETRTAAAQLVEDEEFGKEYAAQIEAIKTTSREQAERTLSALATQLSASGFESAAVDAVINALVQKAGRTDLNLQFAKINFASPEGLASITKIASDSANAINEQFKKTQWGPTLTAQINASAGEFASLFQALKMGFESGEISAADFNTKIADIRNQLSTIDPVSLNKLLPAIAEKLGIEDQLKGLKNVKDQLMLIEAAAAGITIPEDDINLLKKAQTSKDNELIREANKLRDQYGRKIKQNAIETEKLNEQKAIEDEYNKLLEDAKLSIDDQILAIENQNAAYDVLIAAKFTEAEATRFAADAQIAAALAYAAQQDAINGTTAATDELIARLNALLEMEGKAKITPASRGGGGGGGQKSPFAQAKEDLIEQRKEAQNTFAAYAKLRQAGLDVATAFEAAKDPALAAAFATTKPGTKQWRELLQLLKETKEQAKALERLELSIKVQTDFDSFLDDMLGKANEYYDILERQVERRYRDRIKKEQDAIESAEREITQLQRTISQQERSIELDFTRPIEALQEESSDLANDLALIDRAAQQVNEKYDEQIKALQDVKRINQEITNQQKTQISLADALSQGDISQAAALMQTMRGQAAATSAASLEETLNASRQAELAGLTGPGGMTRAQIEQRQFEISQQIFALEEQREAKQLAIRNIQDQIYTIETGRLQNAKDRLQALEDEQQKQLDAIEAQRDKWQQAREAQDLANIRAGKYNDVLKIGKLLVGDIVKSWESIKDKIVKLFIQEVRVPAGSSVPSSSKTSTTTKTTTPSTASAIRSSGATTGEAARFAKLAPTTKKLMYGGVVKKMARGGVVGGTGMGDVVPAMLTPGEFVVNKAASKRFMPMLKQINGTKFPGLRGGAMFGTPQFYISSMPRISNASSVSSNTLASVDNSSVYNYSLSVNVTGGRDMDANQIANVVMTKIKQMDGQRIRRQIV